MKQLAERARIVRAVRSFFDARGFIEVDTPAVVPSPGMELHLDAFEVPDAGYLHTSPEYQMKRLLADGHERIYQICRAFRRGELGSRHNPEFTILEFYRAHAGAAEVMRDTEELVFELSSGTIRIDGRDIEVRPPFVRLSIGEAFKRYASIAEEETLAMAEHDEERFFRTFVDHIEPALEADGAPVFLVDWPASQASLARRKPSDPRVAERFELYVAGVELCNGFTELVDAQEQRARMERDRKERARRGMPVYPLDEKFLDALTRMPESGGNAVGLDRLMALLMGTRDIASALAFTWDER